MVRKGDGTALAATGYSQVRKGDGTVLWNAIPDSVVSQFDATQLSLSDGDTVSTWPDEQNNNDLADSGGPVFRTSGINGYASVEFDGVDDLLNNAEPTITQPFTVIYVAQITGSTGTDHSVFDSESSNFTLSRLDNALDERSWNAGTELPGNSPDTNAHIVTNIGDSSNSLFRVDGTDEASGDGGTNDITGFQLGASYDDSRFLEGYIGELLVYNSRLSSSEMQNEEQRLSDKWGVTV